MTTEMSRREFIKVSSLATGGLLVSVYLAGCTARETDPTTTTSMSTSAAKEMCSKLRSRNAVTSVPANPRDA